MVGRLISCIVLSVIEITGVGSYLSLWGHFPEHNSCIFIIIINPQRGMRSEGYCSCRVCLFVCLLLHDSPITIPRIQRRIKVEK